MNKGKMLKADALSRVSNRVTLLAVAAVAALQLATTAPAHAVDPMMHSSASVGSTKYGTWGDSFTCSTCHKSTLNGGNAKSIAPVVQGKPVNFTSYLSYGEDTGHTTSDKICEVCHTQTSHHRYDNSSNGANHHNTVNCTGCHRHSLGFRRGISESAGGDACDGCHSDLYVNTYGWGMHSTKPGISYKHYMDNPLTGNTNLPNAQQVGASWYSAEIPDGQGVNVTSRRCLMCHVDHDQFKSKRAFNLRGNASIIPTSGGTNRDDTLCLSCHNEDKTKAYVGPNGETTVMPIPFPKITYANATTVLNNTTHGYPITTTYSDGTTFSAICAKCHNDSIGKNGETGKSITNAQKGTFKFGEHNSTVPGRLAIFSNDFYQRVLTGTTLVPNSGLKSVQITPSPGWTPDVFQGDFFVVTGGAGSNNRSLILNNTVDTLTLQTWIDVDNTSSFDVVDDNISVDNTCFNCHSKNGQAKNNGSPTPADWYGQKSMTSILEGIFDLFVGDMGTQPTAINRKTSITVYLKKSDWTSGTIGGYTLRAPGGRVTISGMTAGPVASGNATYPYSYTLSLASTFSSRPGEVEIIKPASHPLDTVSRHESDERSNTGIGWNKGDQGATTTANSATAATQITDTKKTWSGAEFNGLKITFPNLFDASGKATTATITGGGAGTLIFSPAVNGLTTTGGDNYYIGNRHVSCADCHNPHASFKNPEGALTSADSTHVTDNTHVNIPGWYDGIWVGRLIKIRNAGNAEQIRYVTQFDKTSGTYTVSIPFSPAPAAGDNYEVLMGDLWTAAGQSGGRAGSGSSGQWGVIPTGWRTPSAYGNMTGVVGLRKIENVFDNLSTTGLQGSAIAGQRDLCVRCHSSYAYGSATPMTPSGGPGTALARSTDVLDEFNPKNPAHHAVYSRGRNQPIMATGDVAGDKSSYNPYWPAYGAAAAAPYNRGNLGAGNDTGKTVSVNTNGVATFSGGDIPATVLPGWFIYINAAAGGTAPAGTALAQGANKGWFEVLTVDSPTQLTLKPKPTTAYSGSYFKLTAGLGNTFVPPFGPWSILRCTDCHGSTRTDPVGPHASVNKWLIKSLDLELTFDWFDGLNVVQRTPNTGAVAAIFCFNCHRRDVYGDANSYTDATAIATNQIPYRSFSRLVHSGLQSASHPDGLNLKGMFNDDSGRCTQTSTLVWGDISCRHCHVGDKVGGIHGTNAIATKSNAPNLNKGQGKRFLNGATWAGYNMPTTGTVSCYTKTSSNSVSTCNRTSNDTSTSSALYNYTSARY